MKLEMGESLIASWLKHEYGCQIVQSNWKTSPKWGDKIDPKDIDAWYKKIKKSFKVDLDLEFVSKKMKSGQLILQGEVDCIGFSLIMENKLIVEKIYAVDIAFHEKGLNYGAINETCSRIRKKYIRTALTIYQYLGCKEAEIIFATPKVLNGHVNQLKQIAVDVKNVFDELGFQFDFRLFCNEEFFNVIFDPISKMCDEISDTSELFMRSLKLSKLMDSYNFNPKSNIDTNIKNNVAESSLSKVTQMPIGVTALKIFENLSSKNKLTNHELENLCNSEYSKAKLGLAFPALIKVTTDKNLAFINGNRRYYAQQFIYMGDKYLLCNHWVESKRNLLEKWSAAILDGTNL